MIIQHRRAILAGPWGDMVFSNREEIGAEVEAHLTNLKGWFGGVGVDAAKTQRTLGHGLFTSPVLRTGRSLTLEGYLHFQSDADRLVADRFVSGLLWDGAQGTLTVETGDLTLMAVVQLDGEISHAYTGLQGITVQVPLLAPDPFLYGDEQAVQIYPGGSGVGLRFPLATGDSAVVGFGAANPNTRAVITNRGNAESHPLIVVAGDWPSGFVLVADTGETIEFPVPVWSQAPVTVDNGRGTIMQSGMDQSARATRRQWVGIPPGGTRSWVVKALQPGDGYATIIHRDTYI